jgi:hypothetical protein
LIVFSLYPLVFEIWDDFISASGQPSRLLAGIAYRRDRLADWKEAMLSGSLEPLTF